MTEEINYEFERFQDDYDKGLRVDISNNYLDISDYEDWFPNREIANAQHRLSLIIGDFLEDRKDDNYRVYYDWCVHVIHNDLDRKIKEKSRRIADGRKKRFEEGKKNN